MVYKGILPSSCNLLVLSWHQIMIAWKKGYCRPVSLMNTDAKILNKMVTNRIQQYILNLTYCVQVDVILGRPGWFNIWKLFNGVNHIKKLKKKNHTIMYVWLVSVSACNSLLMLMLTHFTGVWLFATPWTLAHQAPLSMGFSWQEYWSGLPCPLSEDLSDSGINPASPVSPSCSASLLLLLSRFSHVRLCVTP